MWWGGRQTRAYLHKRMCFSHESLNFCSCAWVCSLSALETGPRPSLAGERVSSCQVCMVLMALTRNCSFPWTPMASSRVERCNRKIKVYLPLELEGTNNSFLPSPSRIWNHSQGLHLPRRRCCHPRDSGRRTHPILAWDDTTYVPPAKIKRWRESNASQYFSPRLGAEKPKSQRDYTCSRSFLFFKTPRLLPWSRLPTSLQLTSRSCFHINHHLMHYEITHDAVLWNALRGNSCCWVSALAKLVFMVIHLAIMIISVCGSLAGSWHGLAALQKER